MVRYKRRRRFRRRPVRRRRYRGGRRKLARIIQSTILRNAETKYMEDPMPSTFASIGNNWVELKVSNVGVGTAGNSSIGDQIRVKSFMFYGYIQSGAAGGITDDSYNFIRIVLALWDPWATDTPMQTSGSLLAHPAIRKDNDEHLLKRYVDRTFIIRGSQDDTGYIPGFKKVKYYKRWKGAGLLLRAGRLASFQRPKLILSMISDSAAVPNPGFVTGQWRIKYKDI